MPSTGTSYVTNTEDHTDPQGNGLYIKDTIFKEFRDDVKTYKGQLETVLENIEAVISEIPPVLNIPTVDDVEVPVSGFPNKPKFAQLILENYPDIDFSRPDLTPIGNLDFEYVSPTPPDDIDGSFNWSSGEFTSEMWTALFNRVHYDIINGGTGLSDVVYNAIIAREQEARRHSQDTEYSKALSAAGATGFNFPSGHIAAVQVEMGKENLSKSQDALNNLLIKDFDLATENTRFSVTSGLEFDKIERDTWNKVEQRGFDAEKAASEYLVATYNANIEKYRASWEGIKLDLEAIKVRVDAIVAANEGEVKIFLGEASVYESQVRAISDKNKGIVDSRNGEVSVYSSEVEAASKEFSGLVEGMKAKIEKAKLEVTAAIEEGKLDISVYNDKSLLSMESSKAIGKMLSQVIASTLGAINTSLSSSYSATESASESWGHTDSVSEGHSFEES